MIRPDIGSPEAALRTSSSQRYVWYVVGLLTLVNFFNYMDRMALSVMMPSIKADLDLTDGELGLLVGVAFSLLYAVCGIPIARLADRGVRRSIIAIAIAAWSIMTALCGAAQSFWHLFGARVGVGAAESGCAPAASSLLCDYVPYERRPAIFAIFGFGITLGGTAGLALAGFLADTIGWRAAFAVLGLAGLLFAFIVRLTLREPVRGAFDNAGSESRPLSLIETLRVLSGCRTYILVVAFGVANGVLGYSLTQWWPSFYTRIFGLGMSMVGAYLGMAMGAGGAIGLLAGGVLATRAAQRDIRRPFALGVAAVVGALPTALGVLLVPSALASFVLVALLILLTTFPVGLLAATVNSVITPYARSTAAAIFAFSIVVIGSLGPFGVGLLSDRFAAIFGVNALRYALLAPTSLIPIMAMLLWAASRTLRDDLRAAGVRV